MNNILKAVIAAIMPAWILYISQEGFVFTLVCALMIWGFAYAGLLDLEDLVRGENDD